MDKTTLKDRTGISAKKSRTGISVKSAAPVKWDPFDKNPAMQKNQLVPQAGKGMSNKVQSGVGSGQAAQPDAVMEVGK